MTKTTWNKRRKPFPVSPQNPFRLPHEAPLCSNSKAFPPPNSTKIIRSATTPHHPPGLPGFSRRPPPSSPRRGQKPSLGNYQPIVFVAMASPAQPPPSPPSPPPPRRRKRSRSPSGERELGAQFDPQLSPPGLLLPRARQTSRTQLRVYIWFHNFARTEIRS